jgi:hypothetical protein
MTTPLESANPTLAPRRRRLWPWILGLGLAPFVVLGVAAYCYLTLDRAAATLRRQMMAASPSIWHTKVQLSAGRLTLGVVRQALRLVHSPKIADARLALATVSRASVGVYETTGPVTGISLQDLVDHTDAAMQKRGWTRLVTVFEHDEKVLVYMPRDDDSAETLDLCLAVVDGRQMVVVSTTVNSAALGRLIERHVPQELTDKLGRLAVR